MSTPTLPALRRLIGALLVTGALVAPFAIVSSASAAGEASPIRINEVESDGGTPGDWVELTNTSSASVDVSGLIVKDNDDTHSYVIAGGTSITAGGYLALDVDPSFGLGKADSARLFSADGSTLIDSYSWTAHAATTYGRCPNGTGPFVTTVSSTKGAANDCNKPTIPAVKINEVESSGGTPGDWIELKNTGTSSADVSGWIAKDNDDTHSFVIPAGTSIAAGAYLALDVDPQFGLGSADSARLFLADGVTLVDSYSWTAHATTTYGRCPDGTGDFTTTTSSTKGAVNDCGSPVTPTPAETWPGGASIATADVNGVIGGNLSGLDYEASGTAAPGVLWAVKNGPSTLYRLVFNGTNWVSDSGSWSSGKSLKYGDGTGDPDAEGVTFAGTSAATGGLFVATERNNEANTVSRPTVLRYDPSASGTTLNASKEWNLTADLPAVGPNLGIEAITWVPDSYLVSQGFIDEKTGAAYSPSSYADHGTGLFFVGLEANGTIYAYALNQVTGGYTRVATIVSGFTGVMDLDFEYETNHLWAVCDDTCNGRSETLAVATTGASAGRFAVTDVYERPAGMPNYNNEGFTIAPQALCVGGLKPVYWADDTNDGGNALRSGTLKCTVPPVVTPKMSLSYTANTALAAGRVSVTVSATNTGTVPVKIIASTPFGTRTIPSLAPGATVTETYATPVSAIPAGSTATITVSSTLGTKKYVVSLTPVGFGK